jgi:hypothetical protein
MWSPFEQRKIAQAVAHNTVGQLPGPRDRLPQIPVRMVKIRVVQTGWYGVDRLAVETDQVFSMPLHDAKNAVALGRAVFA